MSPEPESVPVEERRRRAGEAAARLVEAGTRVGLGTGRTAEAFIEALAARNLGVRCVATSMRTEALARAQGLEVLSPDDLPRLDLAVDGADEVDPELDLIKGRGGALLRERIVARSAARFVVVVDDEKRVARLGRGVVPLEIVPFAWTWTLRELTGLAANTSLRRDPRGEPVRTENGNFLGELTAAVSDKRALAAALDALPGVVDHGLFLGMADIVLVGGADGTVVTLNRGAR